jgi:hypothetical protein
MPNPESPDRQPPSRLPEQPGTPLRAVLTGMAIDICGSKVVAIVAVTLYAALVVPPDMSDAQAADLLQKLPPSFGLFLLFNVLGALMSVAGGYACARVALRDEFRVGAILAVVATFSGLLLDDAGVNDLTLLYILCDVAGIMLGVKYGAAYNRRLESPARSPADASTP